MLMALALDDNAFLSRFKTAQEIFDLQESPHRRVLRLRWTEKAHALPVFRDVCESGSGLRVSTNALTVGKYREIFQWIGRVCGFEFTLEPYQIRRASGQNINSKLILLPKTKQP